jgi:YHS domain-containing protein
VGVPACGTVFANAMNQTCSNPEILSACGDRVAEPSRTPCMMYQGRKVYFCTVDCLRQYKQDPDAFMAGQIVHTNSNKRTVAQSAGPQGGK